MKRIRSPPGNNTFEVSSSAMIQPTDQTSTKTKEKIHSLNVFLFYRLSQKKVDGFGGLWNKIYTTGIQTKILTYQSKANLDEKILFVKITHLQHPTIKKLPIRGLY